MIQAPAILVYSLKGDMLYNMRMVALCHAKLKVVFTKFEWSVVNEITSMKSRYKFWD